MSDIKSKRAPREPAQGEAPPDGALPTAAAPIVTSEPAVQEPEMPAGASSGDTDRAEPVEPRQEAAEDAFTAVAEAQAAVARGFELIAAEMAGMTRSGIAAATDSAIALLGAKTFAEAVEINAGLARRSFDAMLESSARMTEIAAKSLAEASRPILSGFRVTG